MCVSVCGVGLLNHSAIVCDRGTEIKARECQIIKIWQTFKILRDLLGLRIGFPQILGVILYILGLKIFHNGTFQPNSFLPRRQR